ncbi:DEP domain-containing protein 1A-like isoform X1 [Zootermopsis nevadensis]|uniref:DEP domain-containing protein 1A-like isoform X1 n=2 Tax=Zootermopsis nevadensis TaxID=136037 RepID=UPI000B8ED144|nr:DEP domain-containing protein 1A-like isoform X1 [Zootermopsis nevadensis]
MHVMESSRNYGPYKATKMWNEMVETFRNGIPLKRHRRHIKVYDNCFTGQEAVNWFQSVLQNNLHLGSIVTREQTVQLLNKFLKAGVFQHISASTPFDIHYQFLKEGDLYYLSDISSTRLPLVNKSLNIPPKTGISQWSVKNAGGDKQKNTTSAHSSSKSAVPRLDAHHTVGLPPTTSSIIQPAEYNWHFYASAEEYRPALPLSDQCVKNKTDVCPRQSVQYGTNHGKISVNQVHKEYGSVQVGVNNIPNVENHGYHGESDLHHNRLSAYENQLKGPSENCSRRYYVSSSEQGEVHSEKTMENRHLNPVNSRNTNTSLGYKHYSETFTTLPTSQKIQRSSSMIQPKPDLSKPYMTNASNDLVNPMHNEKLSQRSIDDISGFIKPVHCDINNAPVSRRPYLNVNNSAFPGENSTNQYVSVDGKQIHDYQTYTSQLKCSQNNVTTSKMQEEKNPFRSGSSDFDKPIMAEPLQLSEIGEIWKKVVLARFKKYTPGLETPFKFELQSIPCEWLTANASSEVHLQHDSQFPQSLVAAMNCLIHWPQAVPNEIITAFKEHYFKLQEPLTTFKLYSTLTKVFLYVATGNLAMSNWMVSRQSELSASGFLPMALPPNSCFETAFTSDSPITRIVPQRSVDTLHFSLHGQEGKNVPPKRISSAPDLSEPLPNAQAAQKRNVQSGTKRQMIGRRHAVKLASRKAGRRVRIGVEEDTKLYHFRNKSGGYVNPALSQSNDEIVDTEDFAETAKVRSHYNLEPEQELDYVAALESLNSLMRCSRRDNPPVSIGRQGTDAESDIDQPGNQSSESSSYYTAASSSSSEASSRRSSRVLADSLENVNTGGVVHMNFGENGEKLMVTVTQLLLLCIPVYNRIQLRYLLHFMNQWNLHRSLCVQTDVVDIFTPTILRSEREADFDISLARRIVYFLMSHHELVLSIPSDLATEVQFIVSRQQTDSENCKSGSVTYCQQVSSRQFEHQRLTGSQLALSELLEQILSDCKMAPKEKRKRLKMFQESYPHIYSRRFPDCTVQDKASKKQSRGLLNLATLSRLKSMRV